MNDLAQVLAAFYNATHCEAGVWTQTRSSDAAPTRVKHISRLRVETASGVLR